MSDTNDTKADDTPYISPFKNSPTQESVSRAVAAATKAFNATMQQGLAGAELLAYGRPAVPLPRVTDEEAQGAVMTLLRYIGEDPDRDGLIDTPSRVARAWKEMTVGYQQEPEEILERTFEESCDEMVILTGIQFYSTCEHHMMTFHGTCDIGYLPGKVVGISKLARLVECFARRLQIQERMTQDIANAIEQHLQAKGVGVVVRAHHGCMGCRGVRQSSTQMVTSAMRGQLRTESEVRAEFLKLIEKGAA